ncbi:hypothetical protein [Nonomuraea jabiensis]|uniref:E9imm peptide n=1 Tax=Nonomuraea jabiensis TaxID=882448 RepID=A0A7W9G3P7_9ACTN|nr:hypothetical protein [Nonomuraea jabiensis]MBB5776587.1 hypothetical protein [Nonomuraea jabiensis]
MSMHLNRAEAISLVQRIMDGEYADERELDRWLGAIDRSLVCGSVSDLIFWPEKAELTAEQIVNQALAYRPIAL